MTLTVLLLLTLLSGAVAAAAKENIAIGAKAVQSSTYDELADAEHAVDGNSDSHYLNGSCSHTNYEKNPWLRVELPSIYNITSVTITNRGDCCGQRIHGAQIRIGSSLNNNGNRNKLVALVGFLQKGATKTYSFKATEGRFVNIFLPGKEKILTLCEVQVFADEESVHLPENIAVGSRAVQSSTFNKLADAEHAIDGNSDSHYFRGSCTHTMHEKDPWWRVELPGVYLVTSVTITNRGDCCGFRIIGAQIRVGNSLKNNGNENKLVATVGNLENGAEKTYNFTAEGRFVNIFLPGENKILTVCEVKVFADEESLQRYENIVPAVKAVQSSTYNELADAEHAVDGNSDSHYLNGSCSHTNYEKDPWLRVELPGVYDVTSVAITNRGDGYGFRINGAQIRIGNSIENNGNDNKLVAVIGPLQDGATRTYRFKATEGRYVNIFLPGEEKILTVCEVKVFADEVTSPESFHLHDYDVLPNVALKGLANQSSIHPYGLLAGFALARNAVDGNRNSDLRKGSCTQTDMESSPWWRVSLQNKSTIFSVALTRQADHCFQCMDGAEIRIGDSLHNDGKDNPLCATVSSTPAGHTEHYTCSSLLEGSHVTVILPGEDRILSLCEVEVFGL
ncbi:uncharacterized protein si:ch73-359m17.2 isoform X1 [Astyanax mexicanus]|uniref:uncharacterized protein si:ch73-359m17.2 isoform X1 n=1 Tax=Astyanax mexicanus TaxID=7994 RepID=UPI0020CAD73E|nr:uncharacterized protein si:ch73-359m17.2 isoform X1 [Astyanax mexicanus]